MRSRSSSSETKNASTTSPSSKVNGPSSRATYMRTIVRTLSSSYSPLSDLVDRCTTADLLGELASGGDLPGLPRVDDAPDREIPSTRPHVLVLGPTVDEHPTGSIEHCDPDRSVTEVASPHRAPRDDGDHTVVGVDDVDEGVAGIGHLLVST